MRGGGGGGGKEDANISGTALIIEICKFSSLWVILGKVGRGHCILIAVSFHKFDAYMPVPVLQSYLSNYSVIKCSFRYLIIM